MLKIIIVAVLLIVLVFAALLICLVRLDMKDRADDLRRMDDMDRRTGSE